MTSRIMSAMPSPAVPDPWMTTRWSRIRDPVTVSPEKIAAITTAAVPCMSSLNVQIWSLYLFRMRRALLAPKSSQCSMACGNSFWQAVT